MFFQKSLKALLKFHVTSIKFLRLFFKIFSEVLLNSPQISFLKRSPNWRLKVGLKGTRLNLHNRLFHYEYLVQKHNSNLRLQIYFLHSLRINTSDVKNQPKIQFLAVRSLSIFHVTYFLRNFFNIFLQPNLLKFYESTPK